MDEIADLADRASAMSESEFVREWERLTAAERDDFTALAAQRSAHVTERLEAAQERVACLDALRELIVRSGAPLGTGLGAALVAGWVSVEEVVAAIRAVRDPLSE